jgi:hypothetical protein
MEIGMMPGGLKQQHFCQIISQRFELLWVVAGEEVGMSQAVSVPGLRQTVPNP